MSIRFVLYRPSGALAVVPLSSSSLEVLLLLVPEDLDVPEPPLLALLRPSLCAGAGASPL